MTLKRVRAYACHFCRDVGMMELPPIPPLAVTWPEPAALVRCVGCRGCAKMLIRCPFCRHDELLRRVAYPLREPARLWLDAWRTCLRVEYPAYLAATIAAAGGAVAWRAEMFARVRTFLAATRAMPSVNPPVTDAQIKAELDTVRVRMAAHSAAPEPR